MASEAAVQAFPSATLEHKDPVDSIAGQIPYLSTGDRALLRRMYLTESHEADGVVIRLMYRSGLTAPSDPRSSRRGGCWCIARRCCRARAAFIRIRQGAD